MGWGSMNNVKPRITLNLYEMRFSPQHCFKKENIDSGGVQRFKALAELTFCWSMPTLSLHSHKRAAAWAVPRLISAGTAGEGREESLTFAAGSRCCRSAAGSVGFRCQVKPPSLLIHQIFFTSYCLWMQIMLDNLFSSLTNFPLFWSVSFIFAGHYLSLITAF